MQAIDTKQFEAIVRQYQEMQPAATSSDYEAAAITCGFSVGPAGAQLNGWISYYSGPKIEFRMTSIQRFWGIAAATAALPFFLARAPDQLAGKLGRCNVSGSWAAGNLILSVDGKDVTIPMAIPLAAAAALGWGTEGEVVFTLHA
ncbi:hypothetical protein ACNOYE_14035 [Nannocystaceae bacterium ST9]